MRLLFCCRPCYVWSLPDIWGSLRLTWEIWGVSGAAPSTCPGPTAASPISWSRSRPERPSQQRLRRGLSFTGNQSARLSTPVPLTVWHLCYGLQIKITICGIKKYPIFLLWIILVYLPYIKTMLTKDTHIIAIKNYIDMTTIFFNRRQKVSKVGKKPDFFNFIIFCCVIFQRQGSIASFA